MPARGLDPVTPLLVAQKVKDAPLAGSAALVRKVMMTVLVVPARTSRLTLLGAAGAVAPLLVSK